MQPFLAALATRLQRLTDRGLLRHRAPRSGTVSPYIELGGRRLLDFASNDYLGLAAHPRLTQALCQAARRYGVGSGASSHLAGYTEEHACLEHELAAHLGRERAMLFGSGYAANLGVLEALTDRHDLLLQDRLNHASLVDAGRLSRARMLRYRHADVAQVRRLLAEPCAGRRWVVTDAVFSMDGDIAPLRDLADAAAAAEAVLMADDAHGFGVLGPSGGGTLEELGLGPRQVPVLVGTLGKSLGVAGAFLAGEAVLVEALVQSARTAIYSTAPPPALAAAARAALSLLAEEPWRRHHLRSLVTHFTLCARQAGLEPLPSRTPIQPLVVGETREALRCAAALREQGLLVPAIRPPTVPEGTARLRVSLTADHEPAQVERLVEALARILPANSWERVRERRA